MSYSSPSASLCNPVHQISKPDVMFNGVPTGIAEARDIHRPGNLIAPITAHYRTSLDSIFADGFESGDMSAWSSAVP